jgi:hypothetical protein
VRPEFAGPAPRPYLVEPPIVLDREPVVAPAGPVAQPQVQPATTS